MKQHEAIELAQRAANYWRHTYYAVKMYTHCWSYVRFAESYKTKIAVHPQ